MMKTNFFFLTALPFCLSGLFLQAQPSGDGGPGQSAELPLKRIAILSSGVGYFEHSGNIGPEPAELTLVFDIAAVNDALKSLVINDPSSSSPSVRYAAQNTLERTLKSLKIDLSGSPGISEILNSSKGAELEVFAPGSITGKIIGVEYRQSVIMERYSQPVQEAWLSLFTQQGIRAIAVKDIASFRFIDEAINTDMRRALDLILASKDENARKLLVNLNGTGNRNVSFSYVIPAPVWKAAYRLDLTRSAPLLQGWAIVDNDSDTDWKNVELSLVTGKPVSFIQQLYPPYKLSRPVIPLVIAGIAESRTYESGYDTANKLAVRSYEMAAEYDAPMMSAARSQASAPLPASPAQAVSGGVMQTAAGSAAGDQFEFTIKNPVTLERRQSAMLPLVEGTIKAEKTLVFSGSRASGGVTINPAISVELTNSTGMKLPAGPITVYDGGTYAGDALVEFFPENEKRLISYGEDLSITGNMLSTPSRYVTSVSISQGVMTISRRQSYEWVYAVKNASGEAKKLIIEHPITYGTELVEPNNADDRTATLYRFNKNLRARETLTFKVREETPLVERVTLANLRPDAFLSYASNQEIPANVRAVFNRAIELKKVADDAVAAQSQLEAQMARLVAEQERIRRNLEAAGNQSPQGQEYLKRLVALDSDIDSLNKRIDAAVQEAQRSKREYDNYIATVRI